MRAQRARELGRRRERGDGQSGGKYWFFCFVFFLVKAPAPCLFWLRAAERGAANALCSKKYQEWTHSSGRSFHFTLIPLRSHAEKTLVVPEPPSVAPPTQGKRGHSGSFPLP